MSYVPPQLRNKQSVSFSEPLERKSVFSRPRQNSSRPIRQKPQWLLDEEEKNKNKESLEEQVMRVVQERSEEHFPSLGGSVQRENVWVGGTKKFSELADEWKKSDEANTDLETYTENREMNRRNFELPRFNNIHNFIEPEDETVPTKLNVKVPTEEEWTEVKHKRHVVKGVDDFKSIFDDKGELLEEHDTVWNADENEESCWDAPIGKSNWN